VEELRGNVDTRLGRLAEGRHDAIVLAVAGLRRLGRDEGSPLPTAVLCPAAGQGCLALEARVDDDRAAALAGALTHRPSLVRLTAERALVTALAATCATPLGAHAELDDDGLTLSAFVGLPDGSHWIRDRLTGDPERAALLGAELAERLVAAGAGPLLAAAEAAPEAAGRIPGAP
jgi:hydroxymethylbilane synthase